MPRFDNEGFNPDKRINNDSRDRSVPADENYYGVSDFDFINKRLRENDEVVDNQGDFDAPYRTSRQSAEGFTPEVEEDFELQQIRRQRSEERAAKKQAALKKKKAQRKKRTGVAVAAIILALILIPVIMVESVLGKITYDDKVANPYVTAAEMKSEKTVKNILLLGVDARPEQDTVQSHPDSMMLITIDMKHRCIKMTSFLRDTWVYLASRDREQRLNTANQGVGYCGIVQSIEYLFNIDIEGYVVTDFKMFRKMVDSIGGVYVTVTKAEAHEINSHKGRYGNVKIKAGRHRLTGKQALAYARIRKIDTDFKRTQRQRTVITSIINKVKKNPFKLYSMASGAAPYLETDLSKSELKKIGAMATLCMGGDMPQARVPFDGTWEYTNVGGASVIKINVEKNKELLQDYIYNKSAKELKEQEEKDGN